jgi:hypothetical protein
VWAGLTLSISKSTLCPILDARESDPQLKPILAAAVDGRAAPLPRHEEIEKFQFCFQVVKIPASTAE